MDGTRRSVVGADGVPLGLLTAGSGPPLLLIHGGFGQIERWEPVWDLLVDEWLVTAMDRRGRGSSGDSDDNIRLEYDDIAAVTTVLAQEAGGGVRVFAHSYGATCALGAANRGAPIQHMVLYEPPGLETVPLEWIAHATALVAEGRAGAAMVSFLNEIVGLSTDEVEVLRRAPIGYDILSMLTATLPTRGRGARLGGSAGRGEEAAVPDHHADRRPQSSVGQQHCPRRCGSRPPGRCRRVARRRARCDRLLTRPGRSPPPAPFLLGLLLRPVGWGFGGKMAPGFV